MTEKELQAYQSQPDVEHRAKTSNYSVLHEGCYRFPAPIRIQADIARQLTRIADGRLDEAIKVIRSESTPAPDVPAGTTAVALVEAVKEIDWDGEVEQALKRMDGMYTDDSHEKSVYHFGLKDGLLEAKKIVEITLRLKADHEKAAT